MYNVLAGQIEAARPYLGSTCEVWSLHQHKCHKARKHLSQHQKLTDCIVVTEEPKLQTAFICEALLDKVL